jgi:putative transposase
MARLARVVVPGLPHHVTQRGNGRGRIFFCDDDYRLYRDLLPQSCKAAGVACWAYALMPNHVHLILHYGDTLR